ncbi:MAG: hypothetical protein U9P50_03040 [Patescibacteria group bacterium]|nr:hypothetical protein [Patescibacteria group bacterium]
MDPEDKRIIRKNLELAKENQEILRKMRRGQFLGNITRILYWVIIIGASFGTYYFLQPYIDTMKDLFLQI